MRPQFTRRAPRLLSAIAGLSLAVSGAVQICSGQQDRPGRGQQTQPSQSNAALPSPEEIERAVKKAYESARGDTSGKNADYIPVLAKVPSELFGVAVVTVDGKLYKAGDVDHPFSIQSCSKVFTLCHVMQESGD